MRGQGEWCRLLYCRPEWTVASCRASMDVFGTTWNGNRHLPYRGVIQGDIAWTSGSLKSPTTRLFFNSLVRLTTKEILKAPHHWLFVRGFYLSHQKGPVTECGRRFPGVSMLFEKTQKGLVTECGRHFPGVSMSWCRYLRKPANNRHRRHRFIGAPTFVEHSMSMALIRYILGTGTMWRARHSRSQSIINLHHSSIQNNVDMTRPCVSNKECCVAVQFPSSWDTISEIASLLLLLKPWHWNKYVNKFPDSRAHCVAKPSATILWYWLCRINGFWLSLNYGDIIIKTRNTNYGSRYSWEKYLWRLITIHDDLMPWKHSALHAPCVGNWPPVVSITKGQ